MNLDTPGKRLRWARENRTKYEKPTDAARAFDWPVSTYLGHENGDRNPGREAAKKYGRAYHVPWEWILEGGPLPDARTKKRNPSAPIPIRGEVAAGRWLDLDVDLGPEDFEQIPVAASPAYPYEAQYGLITRGTSLNRVVGEGSVLHCIDLGIAAVEPLEDDIVIVERRRHQQGQREVTAKRISRRGSIVLLSPDSHDRKWKPIELDTNNPRDGEEVAVVALVIGVYQPLRRK